MGKHLGRVSSCSEVTEIVQDFSITNVKSRGQVLEDKTVYILLEIHEVLTKGNGRCSNILTALKIAR